MILAADGSVKEITASSCLTQLSHKTQTMLVFPKQQSKTVSKSSILAYVLFHCFSCDGDKQVGNSCVSNCCCCYRIDCGALLFVLQ